MLMHTGTAQLYVVVLHLLHSTAVTADPERHARAIPHGGQWSSTLLQQYEQQIIPHRRWKQKNGFSHGCTVRLRQNTLRYTAIRYMACHQAYFLPIRLTEHGRQGITSGFTCIDAVHATQFAVHVFRSMQHAVHAAQRLCLKGQGRNWGFFLISSSSIRFVAVFAVFGVCCIEYAIRHSFCSIVQPWCCCPAQLLSH